MLYALLYFFYVGGFVNTKSKYLSSAFIMVLTSVIVKVIGAVYKIPLTAFIGAVGRGYFAAAYNLCMPVHAITMGALPVALSRLVSKYNASGNSIMLWGLKKASYRLFAAVGFAGMGIMLLLAYPYAVYIAAAPQSVYTILVLAPSVLFSCMAASYRAFYEGYMDMVPTSGSQFIEALFKLIFGLLLAKMSMAYMYNSYLETGMIFGNLFQNEAQALSYIYPFTSAFAMLGVMLGSIVSLFYVQVYNLINREKKPSYEKLPVKEARSELISLALPIMFSSAVQGFFQFLGTSSIQHSLSKLQLSALQAAYVMPGGAQIAREDLTTYAYGLYSAALDFKNLVPGITMALGICAVPVISAAFETKNNDELAGQINNIFRYTSLLSLLGGGLLICCGRDMLGLLYSSSPEIVYGCGSLVVACGFVVVFLSLSGVAVFSVQAIGYPQLSIKSYIVSGIIRVILNIVLIRFTPLMLTGAVAAEGISYFVMLIMNIRVFKKQTGVSIKVFSSIIKPMAVFAISVAFFEPLMTILPDFSGNFVNLLIKAVVFAVLFIILCILLKTLNFRGFFYTIRRKKSA